MKKLMLFAAVAVLGLTSVNAQDVQFGATAGVLGTAASIKADGESLDLDQEIGFFVGVTAEFELSDKFNLQPELSYASVDGEGTILLPIIGKYYVADAFNIQVGPTIALGLEEAPEDFTNLGIGLTAGLGFDITEEFHAQARYNFQLNNNYTGDLDASAKGHFWTVGIGYQF